MSLKKELDDLKTELQGDMSDEAKEVSSRAIKQLA